MRSMPWSTRAAAPTRSPRSPVFTDAMDEQPNDYLASFYVDLAGLAEASGAIADLGSITTASAVLVAETDGLKLSGSAPLSARPAPMRPKPRPAEPGTLTGWMPERTVAEITVFDLRSALEAGLAVAGDVPEGEQVTSALDTLRALAAFALGVDLDADLLPLLDGETALAIGGIGADGMPTGQLLLRPSDSDAAVGVLGTDRGPDRLQRRQQLERDARRDRHHDDRDPGHRRSVVRSGRRRRCHRLEHTGRCRRCRVAQHRLTLDRTSAYEQAFDVAGVRAGTEVFVDVGTVGGLLGLLVELPDDARDILSGLGAFALTIPTEPNQIEFRAVLTVE